MVVFPVLLIWAGLEELATSVNGPVLVKPTPTPLIEAGLMLPTRLVFPPTVTLVTLVVLLISL